MPASRAFFRALQRPTILCLEHVKVDRDVVLDDGRTRRYNGTVHACQRNRRHQARGRGPFHISARGTAGDGPYVWEA